MRGCGVVVGTSEHDANEHRLEPYTEKMISKIIFLQQRRRKNLLVNAEIWKAIQVIQFSKLFQSSSVLISGAAPHL